MKIPFNKVYLTGHELDYIRECFEKGDIGGGGHFTKLVSELLEKRFSIKKVQMTTSGTHALEIATRLIGLKAGDEVIMPSFTFPSTANAVILAGGKPVFDEDMFILDIRQEDVYNEGHIKGAVNAPWGTAISDNLEKLPMDKTIMVYCYTGQTAGQAVATLNIAGFDAKSVNLGWNLGIAKVDGVDDVIETTANEFTDAKSTVDPTIKAAIEDYYKGLEALKGTTYANYKISEEDTKELVDSNDENTFILSIRSADDFAKEKIEGAINIPWGKGMEKEFGKLPKDKKIIVYCYTGQTAGQAVAGLRLLGFDAVSLNGGMGTPANAPSGWINKGFSSGPKVESDGQDNS